MAHDQIKEFFRQKTEKAAALSSGIDWAAKRDSWIKAVDQLYGKIERFLEPAESAAYIQVDRSRQKQVREPYVGDYTIPELVLVVGAEEVSFSPKGFLVAGAAGRIDVQGDRGKATLIRQNDGGWSWIVPGLLKPDLLALNEASFLMILQDLMS